MEENFSFSAEFSDRTYVLNDSYFVVDSHYRAAEYFFWLSRQHLFEVAQVHQPIFQNRKVGDLEALGLQVAACIQYALMLRLHRYYMAFLHSLPITCLP